MNSENPLEPIKTFLSVFPYYVVHETGSDDNEYYFCVIDKNDIIKNPILKQFMELYVSEFPIDKISKKSLNYFKDNRYSYYFMYVDKVSIHDNSFSEKHNYIKENANNIISKRTIGEVVDKESQLLNQVDFNLQKVKNISKSFVDNIQKKILKPKR